MTLTARIEQAVFTSAETDRSAGYHVVAAGEGISREDLGELSVWGPSHDALLDPSPTAASLNFHPLPSGAFCVSRTTSAGREYSGRGARIYTQCLITPPDVLASFANNPFAVMRAAMAGGVLEIYEEAPSRLEAIQLAGGTAAVDLSLLARLAANPGPDWMAALVDAALKSVHVALAGTRAAEQLIAGLLNCLPPCCRTWFSFSTGLKFSPRRPFRLVAVGGDGEEQRRLKRLYNATVLDFCGEPPAASPAAGAWAEYVRRVLLSGRISLLATQFANAPAELARDELPALGLQFLEELEVALDAAASEERVGPGKGGESGDKATARLMQYGRAHRAHRRLATAVEPPLAPPSRPPGPSSLLSPSDPHLLSALRTLDELVYEAISGSEESLDRVRSAWRKLEGELDASLAVRWREHYLRYALSLWSGCGGAEGVAGPGRAVRSLDIVCSLLDEPSMPPGA